MATQSSILALENPMGRATLAGYRAWGDKELNMTEATEYTNMRGIFCSQNQSHIFYFSYIGSVRSLSPIRLFATPWTATQQASLSITNSQSLPKLMSIELVMPSNHLILCCLSLPPAFNLSQHQGLFK